MNVFENHIPLKEKRIEQYQKLEEHGLAPDPGFDEYLDYFDKYKQASGDIYHHTLPLSFFMGRDVGYYDRLYTMRQMDAFCADVSETCEKPFKVGRHQASVEKISVSDISTAQVAKIRAMYEDDYRIFGKVIENGS